MAKNDKGDAADKQTDKTAEVQGAAGAASSGDQAASGGTDGSTPPDAPKGNDDKPKATLQPPDAPKGKQWYRIKGPGGVKLNGVLYAEGDALQIGAADAISIDGYLETLPGAPDPVT